MATESGGNRADEVKTQFTVREGTYRLSNLSEYSRPNRTNYVEGGTSPVFLSFTSLHSNLETPERVCFNIGKELFVYPFKGLKKAADLTVPTDKRVYKGTFPTCHAFSEPQPQDHSKRNHEEELLLLVGFSAGQIQLLDPIRREVSILFNQERSIDKSRVTCISWLPNSSTQFIVSHASGSLYIYSQDYQCGPLPPSYQVFKQGESHVVFTCKTKSSRNPMFRWIIGDGAIYEFKFSPCKQYLAVVSQDGFLRVFDFNRMEMVGYMKSYFGGLHCVSWSPDGKYLATGGEDDLITIYSFHENRVICRGRGHRSWITSIAFDPFTSSPCSSESCTECHSDDGSTGLSPPSKDKSTLRDSTRSSTSSRFSVKMDGDGLSLTTYRIGSVSQDTNICLWDITSDILYYHLNRNRTSSYIASRTSALEINTSVTSNSMAAGTSTLNSHRGHSPNTLTSSSSSQLSTLPSPTLPTANGGIKPKKTFTLNSKDKSTLRSMSAAAQLIRNSQEQHKLLGTQYCPKLDDVPLLEPLTCKKLSNSMLTSIYFYRDFLVVASQEGVVSSYARPHKPLLGSKSNDSSDAQLTSKQMVTPSSSYQNCQHMNGGGGDTDSAHSPHLSSRW